jgi:hypothetical protein
MAPFLLWMESLQPVFSGFGHQTMRNDSVGRYQRIKQELRNELQILDSRICFTSYLWTSNQKLGYICLAAHYINADFVLKKKIIAFRDIKYSHTGLPIEEALTRCLIEWGSKIRCSLSPWTMHQTICQHVIMFVKMEDLRCYLVVSIFMSVVVRIY